MDILRNVGSAMVKTGTIPTRMVGFQDELVKQVSYRSTVQSKASMEGESLVQAGKLAPDGLNDYVRTKLAAAFDSMAGRQTGRPFKGQGGHPKRPLAWHAGAEAPQRSSRTTSLRVVVPFLRTPVNLFRQGCSLPLCSTWRRRSTGTPSWAG